MGLPGHLRKSTNKAAKTNAAAMHRHGPSSSTSGAEAGSRSAEKEKRVDEGTLRCKRCEQGSSYHHGHHRTCPHSAKYDGNKKAPVTDMGDYVTMNNKPLQPSEQMTVIQRIDRQAYDQFFAARQQLSSSTTGTSTTVHTSAATGTSSTTSSPGKIFDSIDYDELDASIEAAYQAKMASTSSSASNVTTAGAGCTLATADASTCNETANSTNSRPYPGKCNATASSTNTRPYPEKWESTADNLREVVDKFVEKNSGVSTSAPIGAIAILKHLNALCPNLKKGTNEVAGGPLNEQKIAWYNAHFPPGTISIEVPKQSIDCAPSPFYRAVEGMRLYLVRWELNSDQKLMCGEDGCSGSLVFAWMNLMKHGTTIPVVSSSHTDTAAAATYKCCSCGGTTSAVDPDLLYGLDSDFGEAYPVDPRFAVGNLHLSSNLSEMARIEIVESGGTGDSLARKVYHTHGEAWNRKRFGYYASHKRAQLRGMGVEKPPDWVTFEQYIGAYPRLPTGDLLRDRYEASKKSTLTRSGHTDHMRHILEIQSVGCEKCFAEDHTFDAAKNYAGYVGANCVWDVAVESGEIASLVLCRDKSAARYAHAAEQMIRRENFNPKGKYSDIYPSLHDFWAMLLGPDVAQRLGLFHYVKRITDTYDPLHPDFWQACRDTSLAASEVSREDEINVELALRDGSMNGHQHGQEEIDALKKSKKFNDRYGRFIERTPRPQRVVDENLDDLHVKYKVSSSPGKPAGRGRVVNGRTLFTSATKEAFENAKINSGVIQDFLPREEMYEKHNLSSRSKHGMQVKKSQRPESLLEQGHDALGNFASTGMRASLADDINLEGTCRKNARVRESNRVGKLSPDDVSKIPAHIRGHPLLYDESSMVVANERAAEIGIDDPPFKSARKLGKDTGERFLSEYLEQEDDRERTFPSHPTNSRCQCNICAGNSVPLPYIQTIGDGGNGVAEFDVDLGPLAVPDADASLVVQRDQLLLPAAQARPVDVAPMPSQVPVSVPSQMAAHAPLPFGFNSFPPDLSGHLAWPPSFSHGHGGYFPGFVAPSPEDPRQPTVQRRVKKREREICCEGYAEYVRLQQTDKRRAGSSSHSDDCPVREAISEKKRRSMKKGRQDCRG